MKILLDLTKECIGMTLLFKLFDLVNLSFFISAQIMLCFFFEYV